MRYLVLELNGEIEVCNIISFNLDDVKIERINEIGGRYHDVFCKDNWLQKPSSDYFSETYAGYLSGSNTRIKASILKGGVEPEEIQRKKVDNRLNLKVRDFSKTEFNRLLSDYLSELAEEKVNVLVHHGIRLPRYPAGLDLQFGTSKKTINLFTQLFQGIGKYGVVNDKQFCISVMKHLLQKENVFVYSKADYDDPFKKPTFHIETWSGVIDPSELDVNEQLELAI